MNTPPFRAEHIGSLLRPPALLEARARAAGPAELAELEDQAIAEVLRWQEGLGLRVVTDGEFRRESWRLGFVSKVQGFGRADAVGNVDIQRDDAGHAARIGSAPIALAKVSRSGPIVADEVAYARRHAQALVKATLPAPSYLHYPRGAACVDPRVYPDIEEFFDDVIAVYVQELEALYAAGGRYLQIDEVAQTVLCDETLRAAVRARGDDPDCLVDLYVDLINRVADRRPAGMTIGVHMCRGNAMGKWMASGGYERIAQRSFGALEVDVLFLEYDSARAGGFEPLRFVPKGTCVVLGLVSTKTPQLESMDELRRRIDEAARYVPLERLGLSPQCGFASHHKGTALSFGEQEAKLRRVVETAIAVWGTV
jgi:5-methyltetrahydropteroyltriglutamate--homocysteine methyltransferase